MDIFETCRRIGRRWYVALPALLLAFGAAGLVYRTAGSYYEASASIVLLAPSANSNTTATEAADSCGLNPWCGGSSVVNLGHVTARTMSDDSVRRKLLHTHPGATYVVDLDQDNRSPIMDLWVTAPSAAETLATLSDVRGALARELADRQQRSGATPDDLIRPTTVTSATGPSPQAGGRVRATAATLALGLGLACVAIVIADKASKPRPRGSNGGEPDPVGPRPEDPSPEVGRAEFTDEGEPAGVGAAASSGRH